jgi:Ca-activated chloride channel family protein
MSFTFAHPWFLLLLAGLPLIAWIRRRITRQAAFLYSSVQLVKPVTSITRSHATRLLAALRWAALVGFILGLARPQQVQTETSVKASGIDIAVAIDLSGSMESEDFRYRGEQVNRLFMAKEVLKTFVEKRPGDRIGLIAFAGRAYVASPLTLDHAFLVENIERLQLHMIEDGTAIGSGLTTAINRLKDLQSKSKIIILMTDGQNNAGKVQPLTAAEAARTLGVKVYTIGVGIHGTAPMPYYDVFGNKRFRPMAVDIDEETLRKIADMTGGKYYRADSSETLARIYAEIDALEKTDVEVKKYVQVDERFAWVVIPALGLLLLEIALANTVWRRLP